MAKIVLGTHTNSFPLWPSTVTLEKGEENTHAHIIGKSGMGKSRLLTSLFLQRLKAGQAASLVDPHSDLARDILGHLIEEGYFQKPNHKLLFVEFERDDYYIPFDILHQPHLPPDCIADDIVEAMHRAFPELRTGAAQFDTLVVNGVELLIRNHLPLPALFPLILDEEYRQQLLENVDNYGLQAYFKNFDRLKDSEQANQSLSTLRRINLLTRSPVMEMALGQQGQNVLNFRELMDQGISVIYDLGKIQNANAARLLGCLITVGYERAAFSRKVSPNRTVHHLIIDEFGEFAAQSSEALEGMLSGTRKFGLFVTMSHQTLGQLAGKLHSALQNIGLKISLRIGDSDARELGREYGGYDPDLVKHAADRGHPLFFSIQEQQEAWVKALTHLPKQTALVKVGDKPTYQIRLLDVPDPKVTPAEIDRVKEYYARQIMRHKDQIRLPYRVQHEETIGRTAPRS